LQLEKKRRLTNRKKGEGGKGLLNQQQLFLELFRESHQIKKFNRRLNFTAFKGCTLSLAKKGRGKALSPMFGITPTNAFQSGYAANHPMYGKVAANAMTINVYDIDNVLVHSFPSQVAAAEWLGINKSTVSRHIKSGIP
jgi:NUMOD1 domain